MESYLEYFITNKGNTFSKYLDLKKERGYFEKKRTGTDCSISKVELAAEISKFMLSNQFAFEDIATEENDLKNKIRRLVNTIKSWN